MAVDRLRSIGFGRSTAMSSTVDGRKGKAMKVKVEVTLDVQPEVLWLEYGIERDDVRGFVRDAVESDIHTHVSNLGWLKPGRWDR